MSDNSRTVKARVSDPALLDALEAAEEDSSMADVLRDSLRESLLSDASGDQAGLSEVARRGLRTLRRNIEGERGMVEVGTAESQVANACNIPKETVRPSVFEPLRRHGKIALHHTVEYVFIVVGESEAVEAADEVAA
jgi:hypothetical protein